MRKINLKPFVILLLFSNILSLGVIAYYEYRTALAQYFLDALGWRKMDDRNRGEQNYIYSWASCLKKLRIEADAVFLGNSITHASDFQAYFPDKKIVTLAVPGERTDALKRRLITVVAVKPKRLFVMAGINDLHRSNAEMVERRCDEFFYEIKKMLPDTKIYIQSILPVNAEKEKFYSSNSEIIKSNGCLKKLSDKYGFVYIDLYDNFVDENGRLDDSLSSDGVHINKKGNDIWAREITEYIYN